MLNFTHYELEELRRNHLITTGGEAEIMEYQGKILKVFFPEYRTVAKSKKMQYLANMKLHPSVIKADEIANEDHKFIGNTMFKVPGDNPIHMLTDPVFLKKARYTNCDLLHIVEQILSIAEKNHGAGIIMGDINDFNFLVHKKEAYAIDSDSYNIIEHPEWDTHMYTSAFTPLEAYQQGGIVHTQKTDLFALAVLSFMILTRVHPFGGIYKKNKRMQIEERIMQQLSVLGNHDIGILKSIPSWKWMSPQLLDSFYQIFEKGKRICILPLIQELRQHLTYCAKHQTYYYSSYTDCPICSEHAKVIVKPKIKKQQTNALRLETKFESSHIDLFVTRKLYLSKDHQIVDYEKGFKGEAREEATTEFTENGDYVFYIGKEEIQVLHKRTQETACIEKRYGTPVQVVGNLLYYITPSNMLMERSFNNHAKYQKPICRVFNALFAITNHGEKCIISCYPKKAVVMVHNRCFELNCKDTIREYALKYDMQLNKWLFIYKTSNGSFRTVVFGENRIEIDNDTMLYHTEKLVNIEFDKGRIFEPANGKILKYDYKELVSNKIPNVVEYPCTIVQEDSMLQFEKGAFTIVTKEKVYFFGK